MSQKLFFNCTLSLVQVVKNFNAYTFTGFLQALAFYSVKSFEIN